MKISLDSQSFDTDMVTFTLNIFYCQTNTDNGSDTSYKLTRSSLLHVDH
jgi:hypothetical protein